MQNFVTKSEFDMHWRLFDEMMTRFSLGVTETAQAAGISRVVLSRFRNGKADLGAAKLIALLQVIPSEARLWYISELLGVRPNTSLRSQIVKAPPEEQADALCLLANIFANNTRKEKDPVELAEAV